MENYQNKMEHILNGLKNRPSMAKLLLHSCCAPCSSSVLLSIMPYFDTTLYYYNPNIAPKDEYLRRLEEQKLLLSHNEYCAVKLIQGEYKPEEFERAIAGYENEKEGGERCLICFKMRLLNTARLAKENNFDYFTTTLSVSPHKNAQKLNEIGYEISVAENILYLPADFKKKDGFKKSLMLSNKYGLYRQDYCGCAYSNIKA